MPGCPAPSITTVGGDRRHHFRHLRKDAATEHGPETWHHIESKEVVAEWARTRYPNAVVELEKVLAARARIADVFVTFPDGTRFAIEVQFSSLPVEKFRERHSWYRHAGIVDVWLFIHAGVHLRAGWDDIVRVELSPVHRAALDETGRLLWVNPILRRAGYGTGQLSLGRRTWTTHPQPGSEAPFTTEPLDSFSLAEGGMTSAALEQLDANTSTALAAIDAAARARAEADRQREVARQARVRAAQDRAGARTANAERTAPRNTELLTRWETSPEGASALEYFGGLILPDWFVDDGDLQIGIPNRRCRTSGGTQGEILVSVCAGGDFIAQLDVLGRATTGPLNIPAASKFWRLRYRSTRLQKSRTASRRDWRVMCSSTACICSGAPGPQMRIGVLGKAPVNTDPSVK